MDTGAPDFLFVYGTLMRSLGRAPHAMLAGSAVFEANGSVEGKLVDLGSYPGLLPSGGGSRVLGELYRLPQRDTYPLLRALDRYEGCDPAHPESGLYQRKYIAVRLSDAQTVVAWSYFYNGDTRGLPLIPGGDYLAYVLTSGAHRD